MSIGAGAQVAAPGPLEFKWIKTDTRDLQQRHLADRRRLQQYWALKYSGQHD